MSLVSFLRIVMALSFGVLLAQNVVLSWTTYIVGRDGLCLEVIGGFDDDHIPTQLWPCGSYQRNQLWTFETDGTIRALGKCLVPHSNNRGDYTMIKDCNKLNTVDKVWNLWPDGTLNHVYSNLVLTAKRSGVYSLTTIENNTYAANQCWSTAVNGEPTVTTIIGFRNLCLEAQNENNNVWIDTCVRNREQQQWAVYGDGTIRANFNRNLCLTSTGTTSSDFIILAKCQGTPQQRWKGMNDGTILNLSTNLVMDVKASDPSLRQIILYVRTGTPNQSWLFFPNIIKLSGSMQA